MDEYLLFRSDSFAELSLSLQRVKKNQFKENSKVDAISFSFKYVPI